MLTEEEKTPAIVLAPELVTSTPAPHLRRSPPPGRPPGTLSISELRERITADVSRSMMAEQERQRAELRAELMKETKAATRLGIVALLIDAVTLFAIFAFARGKLGWLGGFGVVAIELLIMSAVWTVVRRGRPHALSLIRLP